MRPSRTWRWFTALVLGTCLAGCKSSGTHSFPSDPLLVSKKPVEVKAESRPPAEPPAPPARVASADHLVPPSRVELLAGSGPLLPTPERPTTAEPPLPDRLTPVSEPPRPVAPAAYPTPTAARAAAAPPGL
jgi:hypothetical protein